MCLAIPGPYSCFDVTNASSPSAWVSCVLLMTWLWLAHALAFWFCFGFACYVWLACILFRSRYGWSILVGLCVTMWVYGRLFDSRITAVVVFLSLFLLR